MIEITKGFGFDAAHTLTRAIDTESSRRIHGHSYRAEIAVRGVRDSVTGMVMDMGRLETLLEAVRDGLDHRFLDDINDLGPGTLENLAVWIWNRLELDCAGLARVTVYRDSANESCSCWGDADEAK
jgi:6-pyruvoyltetrahydropterin/6-carboxytetrahydropterin synthase